MKVQPTPRDKKEKRRKVDSAIDNIYFDPTSVAEVKESGANRGKRGLQFNEKGKFVEQAHALRQQAKLEELKEKIAENSRKVGLQEDLDVGEQNLVREEPPDVEWWDQALLTNMTYDDISNGALKIATPDSIVTSFILHPVPVPGPNAKNENVPLPLKMTKLETKKMRRQNRAALLKDRQDKQRLGLLPPDPAKVKISNMMSVLGSEAIKDPTAVEARIRREVAQREKEHDLNNEQRKLTPEQRREKINEKVAQDSERGLHCAAFRIEHLGHRLHRAKIELNAVQEQVTGMMLLNPKFNLVVVEGGQKAIKHYKRLMLHRIDWTDFTRNTEVEPVTSDGEDTTMKNGAEFDPSQNRCQLIWEGEEKYRMFRYWKVRSVPTNTMAKEVLGWRAEHLWGLATRMTPTS